MIHEDDFYKHDKDIPIDEQYNIQNWDSPEALDFDTFEKELDIICRTGKIASKLTHNDNVDNLSKFNLSDDFSSTIKQRYESINGDLTIVLVDGFMLFNNPKISSKFDIKLLIRSPYQVLKDRRAARPGYQTLDSFWKDPPYYFDEFVYKSYVDSHSFLFKDGNVEGKLDLTIGAGVIDYMNYENPIEASISWVCDQILKAV